MTLRTRTAFVALLLALPACHHARGPSAAYQKASDLYIATLRDKGDEAPFDPRADEALTLARQVPTDSIDIEAARALVHRIEQARADHKAELERVAKASEVVLAPSTADAAAPSTPPVAPVAPARPLPVVGSSLVDLKQTYGECLYIEEPFYETGGTRQGDVYVLANSGCAQRFPELTGMYVAVLEGKVFNVLPKEQAQTVEVVQTPQGPQPVAKQKTMPGFPSTPPPAPPPTPLDRPRDLTNQ